MAMLAMDEQMQTINIEERRTVAEPNETLEDIPLDENNPESYTKVGADMEKKTKQELVQFLKRSIDVFAWSREDMLGIDPSVITHHLNVYPSSKPIRQKKRVFALERDNAIKEEVQKLIAAKFIREVYYLDWLANEVEPNKCTFRVSSRKFLGFMVSHRGIKANLDKIRAILEMKPP